MNTENKIDMGVIKVVNRAIMESDNLEIMCTHLTQLLVGSLDIKGCALFVLNQETEELEPLASFGLSIAYLNKGPVLSDKSIRDNARGLAILVEDVSTSDRLQYPEHAQQEGIQAIVSLPTKFKGRIIGSLRLYHRKPWNLSDEEMDFLQCLADSIGLAMAYMRVLNALQQVKETVEDVHAIWL